MDDKKEREHCERVSFEDFVISAGPKTRLKVVELLMRERAAAVDNYSGAFNRIEAGLRLELQKLQAKHERLVAVVRQCIPHCQEWLFNTTEAKLPVALANEPPTEPPYGTAAVDALLTYLNGADRADWKTENALVDAVRASRGGE